MLFILFVLVYATISVRKINLVVPYLMRYLYEMRKELNLSLEVIAKHQQRAIKKKWSAKKYMETVLENHVKNDTLETVPFKREKP